MRQTFGIALAGWLALVVAGTARADVESDALALIDKAIQATGGEEAIAKFKAQTWEEKGTYYGMGDGQPYTGKYAVQWPGQFRMEIVDVFVIVLNGDKGWTKRADETKEMSKEQLAENKESNYAGYVTTLLPLKGKGFTFRLLPPVEIDGRKAVGITVVHKGHQHVQLYFDSKTHLLVKSERTAKDLEQDGKEVKQESFYTDHKDVEGVKVPMKLKILRDKKLFVEAEHSDVKPVGKLDDSVFAKP